MKRNHWTAVATVLICITITTFVCYRWHRWYHGIVVAEVHARFLSDDLTFIVRQYPRTADPLMQDGYLYGCEVWWRHVLDSASAYNWDSYTAEQCTIDVGQQEVIFNIGRNRIRWSGFAWEGRSAWKLEREEH